MKWSWRRRKGTEGLRDAGTQEQRRGLGKFKSVACVLDSDGGSHVFETLRTNPEVLEEWLGQKRPDRVMIEVGPSSGWVADVAAALAGC